ncbi:alpha/beta fold hydrolase [Sphingorhabdus sp.]|uniref:alpha/beta fold hydrolase n=1 Tax=Sphingorhabdus sp. TaxID=1902408 RepID=UPI003D81C33D
MVSRKVTALAIAISAFVALSGAAAAGEPALRGDGGVPDFYSWQKPLPSKPGKLLRQEALADKTALENAGRAVRILYASTDGLGGKDRVAVSGALYLPKGKAPKGGWPLLAWAHGTVGIGDMCAPSFAGRSPRDMTYLNFWLAKGYAVVASDYQGLGTPGGHPYLATRPVAYSVLDSIRAVQGKTFGIGKRTVLIGQSQGGGAAFATAGIAPAYAPELDIAGTVATGTPYFRGDSEAALDAARPADMVDPLLAYNFYFLSLQEQVDPAFRIEDHVTDKALPVAKAAATQCFLDVARASVGAGLTRTNAFKADPALALAKYAGILGFPTLKVTSPVFMGIGGKDRDVPPQMQLALKADACKAGTRIEAHVYPDADHSGAVNGSTRESSEFVRRAFAGEAIGGNCAH